MNTNPMFVSGEALSLESGELSYTQLIQLSGLSESDLAALVDDGVLQPLDPRASTWTFASHHLVVARTACRLRRDLELDAHAVSLLLRFIERVDALEAELRQLRAQMPGWR